MGTPSKGRVLAGQPFALCGGGAPLHRTRGAGTCVSVKRPVSGKDGQRGRRGQGRSGQGRGRQVSPACRSHVNRLFTQFLGWLVRGAGA